MMSVFGAPGAASRQGVFRRRDWARDCRGCAGTRVGESAERAQQSLEVGVGIATGKAFVGNIWSADWLIWTAIGDTLEPARRGCRASRVELNAAILIDAATRRSAGDVAADFELRERVPIRGRRQTEDVYVLPLTGIG